MSFNIILIAFLLSLFLVFRYTFGAKSSCGFPTTWPIVGMLLALLKNANRFHDFVIELMERSDDLSFRFNGPLFTKMNFILTINPLNIHHIFSKNFGTKYEKGPKFHDMFDVLGDGIFNANSSLWQYHRKLGLSFFAHPRFQSTLINSLLDEIHNSLIPLLDHVSNNDIQIDLQDVFKRFTYDNICTILVNHNPKLLSIHFPPMLFSKALTDAEDQVFRRHFFPSCIWKSFRWLGIAGETKLKKDCQIIDQVLYDFIAKKRDQLQLQRRRSMGQDNNNNNNNKPTEEVDKLKNYDLLSLYMTEEENGKIPIDTTTTGDKFLKDSLFSYFIAGTDTSSVSLTWFFYLVSKYPKVSSKIREELNTILRENNETLDGLLRNFSTYNKNLIYLHGAICECLRLYPPVAFNHKAPLKSDVLPTGHQVNPDMNIIIDNYAMGRMNSVWGDDCYKFKPERWITERGTIKHEPSYKFLPFGAGPRNCLGKGAAITQLKLVIAAIILKYDIEPVEGHEHVPQVTIILTMKNGFNVKIKRHQH